MCEELVSYNHAVRTSIYALLLVSLLAVTVQVVTVLDCPRLSQIVLDSTRWCYRYRLVAAYYYILLYIAIYCCTLSYIVVYYYGYALID